MKLTHEEIGDKILKLMEENEASKSRQAQAKLERDMFERKIKLACDAVKIYNSAVITTLALAGLGGGNA